MKIWATAGYGVGQSTRNDVSLSNMALNNVEVLAQGESGDRADRQRLPDIFKRIKKKLLSGVFALALLVTTGYGVNKSMNSNAGLSYLALSNVEALANGR